MEGRGGKLQLAPVCGGVRVEKETGHRDVVSGNTEMQISMYRAPFVEKAEKTLRICLFLYNRSLEGYPRTGSVSFLEIGTER